jgi:chemotaxis protein MotB
MWLIWKNKKNIKMNMKKIIYVLVCITLLSSCVSTKKYSKVTEKYNVLLGTYNYLQSDTKGCRELMNTMTAQKVKMESQMQALIDENTMLKKNNDQTINQLKDLSVISEQQAQNIKKSLETIDAKDNIINRLHKKASEKDSLNLNLVMNLKGNLRNSNDSDINIKVDKGVVYIDISDKLLFKRGKYEVSDESKEVLAKVAEVLRQHPDMEFMVEGNTDDIPYSSGILIDNWDLSVKRATSVIRVLQNEYGLNPANMIASGRSEYKPIAKGNDEESKSVNRRTRIMVIPQLDQFFKLLEPIKKENTTNKSATRQ